LCAADGLSEIPVTVLLLNLFVFLLSKHPSDADFSVNAKVHMRKLALKLQKATLKIKKILKTA